MPTLKQPFECTYLVTRCFCVVFTLSCPTNAASSDHLVSPRLILFFNCHAIKNKNRNTTCNMKQYFVEKYIWHGNWFLRQGDEEVNKRIKQKMYRRFEYMKITASSSGFVFRKVGASDWWWTARDHRERDVWVRGSENHMWTAEWRIKWRQEPRWRMIIAVIYGTFAVAKRKPEKNSGLYGIRTLALCDTGAALYQKSPGGVL